MLKTLKRSLILLFFLLLGGFVYFINAYAPLIAGYGAKDLCSCAFIGEQAEDNVIKNELGRSFKSLGSYQLNASDSSATGSVFGFGEAKAIYREGLGCTLIIEKPENEIRSELSDLEVFKPVLSDTIEWPMGTKVVPIVSNEVNIKKLKKTIEDSFINEDLSKPNNQRAVVVVHRGSIIAEQYAEGFGPTTPQIGWSMSKSVISALFGILVKQRGFDIYAPAPIPEWKDPNDPRSKITTDQLLRMSSGLEWEENYGKPSHATKMLYDSEDMGLYASKLDLQADINSEWIYSSGTSNILSRILKIELGEDYLDWPFKELFNKVAVTTAQFEVDASNSYVGSSYIWASPRDWARLGLLYLQDGYWNGFQIFPEGWVDYTKTPTPPSDMQQYGAQFWLNAGDIDNPSQRRLPDCPREVYSMNGYEGQRVFIIPSLHMVVVTMAQTDKDVFDFNAFLAGIINCVD